MVRASRMYVTLVMLGLASAQADDPEGGGCGGFLEGCCLNTGSVSDCCVADPFCVPFSCASCDCDAGLTNAAGVCVAINCGGAGQFCCSQPGGACTCSDPWRQPSPFTCESCGGSGQPICVDNDPGQCQPGLVNIAGLCAAAALCGGAGQPLCSSGDPCDPWHMVVGPLCAACGGDDQLPCVPGLSTTPGCNYPNAIGTAGLCSFYCAPDDSLGSCDSVTTGSQVQAWPNGIVYYTFQPGITDAQKHYVREAMDEWGGTAADITFLPWTNEGTYLLINDITGTGMSNNAYVGWADPPATLTLNLNGLGWSDFGRPLHELGHTLGLYHEQSRPDRNQYVDVICENLSDPLDSNFLIHSTGQWLYLHPTYDYLSVMHYGQCLGSIYNGDPGCPCPGGVCNWDDYLADGDFDDDVLSAGRVIVVLSCDEATQQMIGDWEVNGLSAIDVEEMVHIYGTGTSIYVDPTIGGNQGTVADPFNTVLQGGNAVSGATVWIRGATYANHVGTYSTPGTWNAVGGVVTVQ